MCPKVFLSEKASLGVCFALAPQEELLSLSVSWVLYLYIINHSKLGISINLG